MNAKSVTIFGGMFRGKKLHTPEGLQTRPTAAKIRESLFNILLHNRFDDTGGLFNFAGKKILDVFAGSGALGLEALSHGAASAVFCDHSEKAQQALKKNISELRLQNRAFSLSRDMRKPGSAPFNMGAPFEIIFMDPPYGTDDIVISANALTAQGWIAEKNLWIIECAADQELNLPENFTLRKQRSFGKTALTFYTAEI